MDLHDLLEDLLDEAGEAARRGAKSVAKQTRGPRRTVRRVVRAGSAVTAAIMLLLGLLLVAVGDPGIIRGILGGLMLAGGVGSAAAAGIAQALDRRDPDVIRERAIRRGEVTPEVIDEDLSELPRDIRAEFRRMLQARRLVQDLSGDGWVDRSAVIEVDGQVARLHRLLVQDGRAAKLGGTPSQPLRQQVGDLADLLVALADEAVGHQVDDLADRSDSVGVTLTDAQDHLVALREARREVNNLSSRLPPEPDLRLERPSGA